MVFHTLGTLGFEASKSTLIRLLALILILGWAARLGARLPRETGRTLPIPRAVADILWRRLDDVPRPLRSVALALVAYLASLIVSTLLSVAPAVSVWGSYDRLHGLVTSLAFVTLGIAAAVAGRGVAGRRLLVTAMVTASLPVCLYALAQRFRLDPIDWLHRPLGVTSTLGSSTALGTYIAMLIPPTLVGAIIAAGEVRRARAPSPGHRLRSPLAIHTLSYAAFVMLGLVQVVVLVLTEVRGALVGLVVGMSVTAAALSWQRQRRMWAMAVVAAAGLAMLVYAVAGASQWTVTGSSANERGNTSGSGSSVRQRLLIWQASFETVASSGWRVLVGFGPETQMLALEPRFPPELASRYPDARFDRAHNVLIDQLLTTGVLGVAVLLTLVGAVVRCAATVPGPPDRAEAWLAAGLLGGLAANFGAGFYAFDSIATGSLVWLIGGLLIAGALPRREERSTRPSTAPAAVHRRAGRGDRGRAPLVPAARLRVTAPLAAIGLGLAALPSLVGPMVADVYHTRALALRAGEAPALSLPDGLAATTWATHHDVYALALGETFREVAETTADRESPMPGSFGDLTRMVPVSREGLFQAARLAFERAVEVNGRDPYSHVHLARLWALWGEVVRDPSARTERLARAADSYDAAILRGPNRATFYDEAGQVFLRLGRPDDAVRRYLEAEALEGTTAERLARRGDAEVLRGDAAAARAWYARALALDARSAPAEHGLALLDRAAGDQVAALEHAQRAARHRMRNWLYQRDLALVHRDLGQLPEALVAARAARRLAPAWEWDELTQLIESVRD